MDSSDDSFAWSDASKDSDDMDANKNDETEESGINYKKTLQENLFNDEQQEPKKKSKKRKHEETAAINESEEVKPKRIKSEPESDFDAPKKKKKKKSKDDSNIKESQESNNSDADSYLNYLVKQEQISFTEPAPVKQKKKKRHKRDSEMVTSDDLNNPDLDMSTEENHIENDVKEEIESKKKKDKKSKHEANTSTDDFEPSDDNSKAKKKSKKKKQEKIINSTSYDKTEIPQISQIEDISAIDSSTLVNNYLDDDQSKVNVDVNDTLQEIESNTSPYPDTSSSNKVKKSHKIADRLRFEDDENSVDYTLKENDDDTKLSKNLVKFIESNSNFSIVKASAQKGTMLTPNDEIWIIKVPDDLNVQDFAGINMKLGGRNKLKVNGQTYDLVSDDSIKKASILKCDKNKIQLAHVPINSIINVHKRIPKAHIPEENVMVNHQPNFIPLPETKCRHPLFGVNYRKAINIASSVAERLNETVVSSPVDDERVKKKKHKKEKKKLELESESEMKPLDEEASVITSKKKRKRKSSIKEEPVTKKAKYVNNEDTGDVWESEQAIEKNLFDF